MSYFSSLRLLPLLGGLYEALLILFPRSFRQAYGPEMAQVFRTSCRETQRRDGARGLVLLCSRALGDVVWSSTCEWVTRPRARNICMRAMLSVVAVLLASMASSLHGRRDADDAALAVLLAGSFLCGVIHPKGAWWWALLIGVGLPGGRLLGHITGFTVFNVTDTEFPLMWAPTFVGAYAGAAMRWLTNRSWSKGSRSWPRT